MKKYYLSSDPDFYGNGDVVCVDSQQVCWLAHEWGKDPAEVWETMREADAEEIAEYGTYDSTIDYYSYRDLLAAATRDGAEQEDVNNLGEWFSRFGERYWNLESYDADGLRLYPVIKWDAENDQGEIVGYEFR